MEGSAAQLLTALRQFDESERIEAKRATAIGESVLETVCAFANEPGLGGGWLLLGVEKASEQPGDYQVAGIDDPDGLLNDLHSQCANAFNAPIRIQARAEEVEGRTVIVVDVPEAEPAAKPIHFARKGLPRGAFRRSPNGDYRCNQDDLASLYQGRSGRSFDAGPVTDATLEDIDTDALAEYRQERAAMNPSAEELDFSDEELLEALGAVARQEGKLVPTVGGLLLFGRRVALRRLFPAIRVDYIRVPGKEWMEDPEHRFDTTLEMRDCLTRLVKRARAAVLDDLPRAFQLPEGSLRREEQPLLPERVVREAIVNALMHRNYQRQQPIQIIRFSNRLEVHNPGYSLKPLERLGEPGTEWRNPVIAQVLHETGYAETKGSGIRVMRRHMQEAGLSPPSFESDRHDDAFAATYLFHHFLNEEDIEWLGQFTPLGLDEEEARALVFVRERGRISNADYRDLTGVDTLTASQHLCRLRDLELLEQVPKGAATYYVPGSRIESAQTRELGDLSPESHPLSEESGGLSGESGSLSGESEGLSGESAPLSRESLLGELPEWLQREVQQLGQRSRDTRRFSEILTQLCAQRPFTARELSALTGRNPAYLQQSYLNPLLREGWLCYRHPEDPNRPDQAYMTPETRD